MSNQVDVSRASLRLAAALLLSGQIGYIAVTQFHAGGHANEHHEIFETYAHDQVWGAVHLGQFSSFAVLVAGFLTLARLLDHGDGAARWLARFGGAAAIATLALYGVLQAVDGVALRQAVTAWATAPEAEQAARFATAEAIRWLEWGMRSYHDYAFGVSLILFAASFLVRGWLSGIGLLLALSGVAYLAQGWIAGSEGFSDSQSVAIVVGWSLSLIWMSWLAAAAWLVKPGAEVAHRR